MRLPKLVRTSSFRLASLFALIFTVSVVVIFCIVYATVRSALTQQIENRIAEETA